MNKKGFHPIEMTVLTSLRKSRGHSTNSLTSVGKLNSSRFHRRQGQEVARAQEGTLRLLGYPPLGKAGPLCSEPHTACTQLTGDEAGFKHATGSHQKSKVQRNRTSTGSTE